MCSRTPISLVSVLLISTHTLTAALAPRPNVFSTVKNLTRGSDFEIAGSSEEDCSDWSCLKNDAEWGLSDGAIAGIVIALVIIFLVIPVALCFCCAWCCFKGRRGKKVPIVAIAAPIPQYQYQQASAPPRLDPGQAQIPYSSSTTTYISYPGYQNYQNQPVSPIPISHQPSPYPRQQYANVPSNNSTNGSDIYEQPPPYYAATSTATNHL